MSSSWTGHTSQKAAQSCRHMSASFLKAILCACREATTWPRSLQLRESLRRNGESRAGPLYSEGHTDGDPGGSPARKRVLVCLPSHFTAEGSEAQACAQGSMLAHGRAGL